MNCISTVADITTGTAAALGAAAAICGLRTWRQQLRGRTEYELGRRLLRAVYRVRDAVEGVRNPGILPGEFAVACEEAGIKRAENAVTWTIAEETAVYNRRWKRVTEAMSDLQLEIVEAEVLWGSAVIESLRPLRTCAGELFAALSQFLRSKGGQWRQSAPETVRQEENEKIVYKMGATPDEDQFGAKVMAAVAEVERIVRPHLKI